MTLHHMSENSCNSLRRASTRNREVFHEDQKTDCWDDSLEIRSQCTKRAAASKERGIGFVKICCRKKGFRKPFFIYSGLDCCEDRRGEFCEDEECFHR
jgi:hypothetical protein